MKLFVKYIQKCRVSLTIGNDSGIRIEAAKANGLDSDFQTSKLFTQDPLAAIVSNAT